LIDALHHLCVVLREQPNFALTSTHAPGAFFRQDEYTCVGVPKRIQPGEEGGRTPRIVDHELSGCTEEISVLGTLDNK